MVRVPNGWRLHMQAPASQPARMGVAARRITAAPQELYRNLVTVPIGNEGNASGLLNASGAGQLQVGPSGIGNAWYPVSIFVGTGTGIGNISNDNSQCVVYVGTLAIMQNGLQVLQPGTGLVGSIPESLTPGEYIFAVWTGGKAGDSIALNVNGAQDALTGGY
jgi:hypothetical protein